MTIINPTLVIEYTDTERVATITQTDIIGHSIKLFKQLLNDLSPSSNRAELQLTKDCAEIENIIACETDIKAVLKNNGTAIFTGYLATGYTWSVTENGEQALSLSIEDVGTRLLEKEFIHSGYHTFNSTVEVAVRAICATAGVTIATGTVFPQGNVIRAINSAVTCKAVLSELLAELNYVYYFNANGELCLFEVKCDSTSSLPTFDKNNICSVNGSAISLSKKIRQYKNARVVYTETGSANNYTIYRNTTKDQATETDPCYLELTAGQHFDGTEKYTPQAGVTRTPAYIEAVNALSEGSIVGSNEILVVTSVTPDIVATSGLSATVNVAGGKYLSIDAKNTGSATGHFSKLDVKGSIIYVRNTNIILTSNEEVATTQSDNIVEQDLLWVHTKEQAQKRANLLAQYHKYASSVYTFYSTTHISAGTIVRLHDDVRSGLDVNVLITRTVETDSSEIVEYEAVGISVFDLDKSVIESKINAGGYDNRNKGEKGDPGEGTVVVVQYSKGTATRPYYGVMVGFTSTDTETVLGVNQRIVGRSTWTDQQIDETTLDPGEYIWMRIGSYTPPQTEGDITNWRVSRLTGSQGTPAKVLMLKPVSFEIKKDLTSIGDDVYYFILGVQQYSGILKLRASYGNFYDSSIPAELSDEVDISLSGDLSLSNYGLRVPFKIGPEVSNINVSATIYDGSVEIASTNFYFTINDKTRNRDVLGLSSLQLDDAVYEDTTDSTRVLSKTYYKIVNHNGVVETNFSHFPYDSGGVNKLKEVRSFYRMGDSYVYENAQAETRTLYVFTTNWTVINSSVEDYDQILEDNTKTMFAGLTTNNHIEGSDYDFYQNVIANRISSVVYRVLNGGYIYGLGEGASIVEDSQGNRTINGKGFILDHNGNFVCNNATIKDCTITGNSTIESGTTVKGKIENIARVNGVNKVVFTTNMDDPGNAVIAGAKTNASTIPQAYYVPEYQNFILEKLSDLGGNSVYQCSGTLNGKNIQCVFNLTNTALSWSRKNINPGNNHAAVRVSVLSPVNYPRIIKKFEGYPNGSANIVNSNAQVGSIDAYAGSNLLYHENSSRDYNNSAKTRVYATNFILPANTELYVEYGNGNQFTASAHNCNTTVECDAINFMAEGYNFWSTSDNKYFPLSSFFTTEYSNVSQTLFINGRNCKIDFSGVNTDFCVTKYYKFAYSQAPTNPELQTAVRFVTTPTFSFTGTTYTAISVTFSTTQMIVNTTNGNAFPFTVNQYCRQFSFNFSIENSELGAYALNVIPLDANGQLGNGDFHWSLAYIDQLANDVLTNKGGMIPCSKLVTGRLVDLQAEVAYSNGMMGSISMTEGGPAGDTWYNFLYIPHRTGGSSGDNHNYGTLLLMTMTDSSGFNRIWKYVQSGGIWYGPAVFTAS